ncbi:MAG: gamma-butyrobetaine hydroxylase-like domain-containing protein [Opitutales bacterium]
MSKPASIEIIGAFLAIRWEDGREDLLPAEVLREESPSAENKGEVDVLGRRWGGEGPRRFPGVTVTGWSQVGNYALALRFSDGHDSGIYSWDLLRSLAPS